MKVPLALGIVLVAAACDRVPSRPPGLPAEAQWVGKGRTGRFVIIGARDGAFWHLELFEAKGQRHPVTRWRVQGYARTSLELQEIVGLEGEAILLNDGARLVPAP